MASGIVYISLGRRSAIYRSSFWPFPSTAEFHFLGTSLQHCSFFNMLIQFTCAGSRLLLDYWWHDKQGTISARRSRKKFENHFSFSSIVFVCALTSFCNHARHKSNLIVLLTHTDAATHTHTHTNRRSTQMRKHTHELLECTAAYT